MPCGEEEGKLTSFSARQRVLAFKQLQKQGTKASKNLGRWAGLLRTLASLVHSSGALGVFADELCSLRLPPEASTGTREMGARTSVS